MVYHDALSLMTAKDSVEYMKEKGFYDHWIRPQLGLNAGTTYADRMTGDSPELNPLDTMGFADLHRSVNKHVTLTKKLEEDDERKFSLATINGVSSAYVRVWDPSFGPYKGRLPSRCICEDTNEVMNSMETIRQAKGVRVKGLGDRNGVRKNVTGVGRGGGMA